MKILGGTEVEIKDKKHNKSSGIQKGLVHSTYKTAKSMNDKDKVAFRHLLQKTVYYDRIPTKGSMSGRDNYIKKDLDNDVRTSNLDIKLRGKRNEKFFIPSNVIDFYSRLEVLLGLILSGHTDSNLIDEFYKRGGIQTEQQYRNALEKFTT